VALADNAVTSALGQGGAYYWQGQTFGADQYSQVTLLGAIGDWLGVFVRGSSSPTQSYVVAVKPDGAHLYAFINQAFYELVHNPTPWATGDVLRLEVQTVGTTTARLTVLRNGNVLFTTDEATRFIADGQPGLGLYATAAMALDDWQGGALEPPPPPPPSGS
jgi:hypothetical protein